MKPLVHLVLSPCCFDITENVFLGIATQFYRGADKFLARPGRKQATATEDFDVHISHLSS